MKLFYTPKQVNSALNMEDSYSQSPLKPRLVVEQLQKKSYWDSIEVMDFPALERDDFLIAHEQEYVEAFLNGIEPKCSSNSVPWSSELAESVYYTNASLYYAIKYAAEHENAFCFSPTSGFHHARPSSGSGFCTFSGQVIGSVKLWRESGKQGAYLDLDGHYGNSIGDSREFCPDVDKAISMNLNPTGTGDSYLYDLESGLEDLADLLHTGQADYVVWCHGADSHEDDDICGSGALSTEDWLRCSEMFYSFVRTQRENGINVPVVACLFGGYRSLDYDFVINLHIQDLEIGMQMLSE